jgi:hypothetical protein
MLVLSQSAWLIRPCNWKGQSQEMHLAILISNGMSQEYARLTHNNKRMLSKAAA